MKLPGYSLQQSVVESLQNGLDDYELTGVTAAMLSARQYFAVMTNVTLERCARLCLAGSGEC